MNFEITFLYTIVMSLILLILSFRVLDMRGSPVSAFLHGKNRIVDEKDLKRAIRGHGNFTEYTPLFLILMFLCEINNASVGQLHLAGLIFTIGRVIHGICFCFIKEKIILRIIGTALTFTGYFVLLRYAISSFL